MSLVVVMQSLKGALQPQLEVCKDEEKRTNLNERITECDELIQIYTQDEEDTATDDDENEREGIKLC